MSHLYDFLANPQVHDTLLWSMVVTSGLAALPKPSETPKSKLGAAYKFLYDWATGFWSMRTGHPVTPDSNANPTKPGEPAQE